MDFSGNVRVMKRTKLKNMLGSFWSLTFLLNYIIEKSLIMSFIVTYAETSVLLDCLHNHLVLLDF